MLARGAVPKLFQPYFAERSFLYLGFSLGTFQNRLLMAALRPPSASSASRSLATSWAMLFRPSAIEIARWQQRDVVPFSADLLTFEQEMKRLISTPSPATSM